MSIFESRISGFFGGGGGGGGLTSVTTDNLTILGDGSVGRPLYATGTTYLDANVDLSIDNYYPPYYGTYIVKNFGGYIFYLPRNTWDNGESVLHGQRITIINSQQLGNLSSFDILCSGGSINYQGTNFTVFNIPSGMTYEFVFNSAEGVWYCYNFLPNLTTYVSLDLQDYTINASGIYNIVSSLGFGISFDEASYYNGLKFVIINSAGKIVNYVGATKYRPSKASGTIINTIPTGKIQTIIPIGNSWKLVAQY